ncbi:hypothetical protein CRQ35_21135 [Salmonella enterica]|nr:hypothetical protein [Salmonella enterica]
MPDGAALIRPTFLQLPHTQKSPSVRTGFFTCLMPGSLWPATLRAVAAQRVLTGRPQIKQKAQSFD